MNILIRILNLNIILISLLIHFSFGFTPDAYGRQTKTKISLPTTTRRRGNTITNINIIPQQQRKTMHPATALTLTLTASPMDMDMDMELFTTAAAGALTLVPVPVPVPVPLSAEQQLEFWVAAFATSHIGMSAVRDRLIGACGALASRGNLVGRGLKLPSYWPGDDVGKNEIFPDQDTAGRQLYRLLYTMVSFTTLGAALLCYLSINADFDVGVDVDAAAHGARRILTEQEYTLHLTIASASFAASIASIFNASPLGLMPSFQKADDNISSSSTMTAEIPSNSVLGLERNDNLKFDPRGLTRITRHPLILPVVPWGISTSILAGGRVADFALFGGLSLYAIAGCACQDLRIIRREGSVGTIFRPAAEDVRLSLDRFYASTSFVPFAAVVDGRQDVEDVVKEFPLIPFVAGFPIGMMIEEMILDWLL